MRTIAADDISKDWPGITAEASKMPLRVQADGLPDMIILSRVEYETYKRLMGERLIQAMDRLGAEAMRRGLTEEKLEELLANES